MRLPLPLADTGGDRKGEEEIRMPFVLSNGHRVYYEDTGGSGPAVVLTHGMFMCRAEWDPQIAALTPEYRCVTWDTRGFGQTECLGPFTFWDLAGDLVVILDHLGIDRAVLVGHSQGGWISLRVALEHPDRVTGLVLVDTHSGPPVPEQVEAVKLGMEMGLANGTDDTLVAMMTAGLLNDWEGAGPWQLAWRASPTRRLEEPVRALLTLDDVGDRLGEIKCPALIIHSEGDVSFPIEWAEANGRALPDCRGVVHIAGPSHTPNLTAADRVNEALAAFLHRVCAPAAV